jgi:hypothetical protein
MAGSSTALASFPLESHRPAASPPTSILLDSSAPRTAGWSRCCGDESDEQQRQEEEKEAAAEEEEEEEAGVEAAGMERLDAVVAAKYDADGANVAT